MRLHARSLPRKLLINPDLALGEAYMNGTLTVDEDDLYGLVELLVVNLACHPDLGHYRWLARFRRLYRRLAQFNSSARSRRNVAHHYDLSSTLYDLFLDTDRQYSCGYFHDPDETLEAAQENKKALIAAKLLLKPGDRVLDIGCGWGGLGLYLAHQHGVHVTGVTLSQEQLKIAQERAVAYEQRARFLMQDYRQVAGVFDRIVSVGMFEHVGTPHYREFFDVLRDHLSDDGVALLHTIGRADGPGATNPWMARYIFPGGYSPALSEILAVVERSGLYVTDIEVWRLHYAETLRAWRRRFEANQGRAAAVYDDRFCRMWRFYLVASEVAFRHNGHVVFQIQLAKKQDAVPLTRHYLSSSETRNEHATKAA